MNLLWGVCSIEIIEEIKSKIKLQVGSHVCLVRQHKLIQDAINLDAAAHCGAAGHRLSAFLPRVWLLLMGRQA